MSFFQEVAGSLDYYLQMYGGGEMCFVAYHYPETPFARVFEFCPVEEDGDGVPLQGEDDGFHLRISDSRDGRICGGYRFLYRGGVWSVSPGLSEDELRLYHNQILKVTGTDEMSRE